jgi:DNA-binding PadR family transcriptional regulator
MHAHPMITPLLPFRSPAEIEATYPADAAMAYAVIWANMLGHLKSPQQVDEYVCRYAVGGTMIGLRALSTNDKVMEPLLPELDALRIDPSPLSVGAVFAPGESAMKIRSAGIEFCPPPGRGADTASLINWLNALRVVSPGRLGSILEELESAGWIQLDGDQYRLTEDGESQLQRLKKSGKFCVDGLTIARWRIAFDDYYGGNRELRDLLEDSNRLFGSSIKIPIDELETMITGTHTVEEAYAQRDKTALTASRAVTFPSGMNPEILIAEDDPLREKRNKREEELLEGRTHTWLCLSAKERMMIRFGAELASCTTENESQCFMNDVLFDVRPRWLIGLGAEASPPSREDAARAYSAWNAGRPSL